MEGGGTELITVAHQSLSRTGFRTVLSGGPEFNGYDPDHTHLLLGGNLTADMVGPRDTVLWAYGWEAHFPPNLQKLQNDLAAGGRRIFQAVLGHHPELLLAPRSPDRAPLADMRHYIPLTAAGVKHVATSIGERWFQELYNRGGEAELVKSKQDMIIVDSDTPAIFIDQVLEELIRMGLAHVQLLQLKGLNFSELVNFVAKAKIVTDMSRPGYEMGNVEAALLGAVVVPSFHQSTAEESEFPNFDHFRVYLNDPKAAANIYARILKNYTSELAAQARFRRNIYRFREWRHIGTAAIYADDATFHINLCSKESYSRATIFMSTLLAIYPFANIDFFVCGNGRYFPESTFRADFNAQKLDSSVTIVLSDQWWPSVQGCSRACEKEKWKGLWEFVECCFGNGAAENAGLVATAEWNSRILEIKV